MTLLRSLSAVFAVLLTIVSSQARAACLDAPSITSLGKEVFDATTALNAGDLDGFARGRDRARLLLPCVRASESGQNLLPAVAGLARLMGATAYLEGHEPQATAWFSTARALWPSGTFTPTDPKLKDLWVKATVDPTTALVALPPQTQLSARVDDRYDGQRPVSRPALIQLSDPSGRPLWAGLIPPGAPVPYGEVVGGGPISQVPFEQGGQERLDLEVFLLRGELAAARQSLEALKGSRSVGLAEAAAWLQRAEERLTAEEAEQRGSLAAAQAIAERIQNTASDPRERAWVSRFTRRLEVRKGEAWRALDQEWEALSRMRDDPYLSPEDRRWVEQMLPRQQALVAEASCKYDEALSALSRVDKLVPQGSPSGAWVEVRRLRIETLRAMSAAQDDQTSLQKLLSLADSERFPEEASWAQLASEALALDRGDVASVDRARVSQVTAWIEAQPECSPARLINVGPSGSTWRGAAYVGLDGGVWTAHQRPTEDSEAKRFNDAAPLGGLTLGASVPLGQLYSLEVAGAWGRAARGDRDDDEGAVTTPWAFVGAGPSGARAGLITGLGVHRWRYWACPEEPTETTCKNNSKQLDAQPLWELVPELGLVVRPAGGAIVWTTVAGVTPGLVPVTSRLAVTFGSGAVVPRAELNTQYLRATTIGVQPSEQGAVINQWTVGVSAGGAWRWR